MDKNGENEEIYPVRSLHDFLSELNEEWSKFRNGSILSMIASGAILVFLFLRYLRDIRMGTFGFIDAFFMIIVTTFLVYSIYVMMVQYRFYGKWERRIGLLMYLEKKILSEKLNNPQSQ